MPAPQHESITVRRSELACPAHSLKMMAKAAASEAEEVIYDLEDGCAPSQKIPARKTLIEACQKVGKRVNSVVNHDGAHIAEALYDDYAEMIEYLSQHYYLTTTRYSTSAFARMKMKEAMAKRGLQPHVFERREAAETFLQVIASEEEKAPA